MLRNLRRCFFRQYSLTAPVQTFLTEDYKCLDAWKSKSSSPILSKVNLSDFYNLLDQSYNSKGVISAIDVDIFANSLNDSTYIDEFKELLHRLRLSADTVNTLESTHHATVRNFLEFGNLQDLVEILQDPLNYGVFLDFYTANILLDKIIGTHDYKLAANIAALLMLQEDFSHDISNALSKYVCYKFLLENERNNEPVTTTETKKKVDEIKIRVKYLRNPYHDDHFDLKDIYLLSGKTLAWISKKSTDNVNKNLQIIGWLFYKKYDVLLSTIKDLKGATSFKLHGEVLSLIERELKQVDEADRPVLQNCIEILTTCAVVDTKLEDSLKNEIENAINKMQSKDIKEQEKMFKAWEVIRGQKLEEQSKRLDRARRIKEIEEKQKSLEVEEQKLWFFENEETIDLQIEEKEALEDKSVTKQAAQDKSDENYIPPEILPKKR